MQNNRCTYIEGESYGSRKGPKEPLFSDMLHEIGLYALPKFNLDHQSFFMVGRDT
jgi:hypothetical protein